MASFNHASRRTFFLAAAGGFLLIMGCLTSNQKLKKNIDVWLRKGSE
jgi:hypothetical protein